MKFISTKKYYFVCEGVYESFDESTFFYSKYAARVFILFFYYGITNDYLLFYSWLDFIYKKIIFFLYVCAVCISLPLLKSLSTFICIPAVVPVHRATKRKWINFFWKNTFFSLSQNGVKKTTSKESWGDETDEKKKSFSNTILLCWWFTKGPFIYYESNDFSENERQQTSSVF